MALTISVNGGEPEAVRSIVLYDDGLPIAAAKEHAGSIIWADVIRDHSDLITLLKTLGVKVTPVHQFIGTIDERRK